MKMLKSSINLLPSSGPKSVSATTRIRGSGLQSIRKAVLLANPACVMCSKNGIVTPATQVDHVVGLYAGGSESMANRQGLCVPCHLLKSAQEAKERNGG